MPLEGHMEEHQRELDGRNEERLRSSKLYILSDRDRTMGVREYQERLGSSGSQDVASGSSLIHQL